MIASHKRFHFRYQIRYRSALAAILAANDETIACMEIHRGSSDHEGNSFPSTMAAAVQRHLIEHLKSDIWRSELDDIAHQYASAHLA